MVSHAIKLLNQRVLNLLEIYDTLKTFSSSEHRAHAKSIECSDKKKERAQMYNNPESLIRSSNASGRLGMHRDQLPGSPSPVGSRPGVVESLKACGLSGPRGFESHSRRQTLQKFRFLSMTLIFLTRIVLFQT